MAKKRGKQTVFSRAPDWEANAILHLGNGFSLYARGYREVGRLATKQVLERASEQDILIYPIAFNYRQFFELMLKDCLRTCVSIADVSSVDWHQSSHNIDELWKDLKIRLNELCPKQRGNNTRSLNRVAAAFSEFDKSGQSFRYPFQKDDTRSLNDLKEINIRQMVEAFEKAGNLVEGINAFLGELLGHHLEMRREFQREYLREYGPQN